MASLGSLRFFEPVGCDIGPIAKHGPYGMKNDLKTRLKEHRSYRSKGSQVLGEFVLLHTEEYADHKSARKREKFLKSGQGREWLNKFETQSEPAKGW